MDEEAATLLFEQWSNSPTISLDQFVHAAESSNIQLCGMSFDWLHSERVERVHPPVLFSQAQDMSRRYLARCMVENPQGAWSESRFEAAWTAAAIVKKFWNDFDVGERSLWKEWARSLCLEAGEDVRHACETGFLEHVFYVKAVREFFADWKQDQTLAPVLEACAEIGASHFGPRDAQ